MELLVTHDHRFVADGNSNVLTDNDQVSGYNFFSRYLTIFDRVHVVGRVKKDDTFKGAAVTGKGVSFLNLPHFHGPAEYVRSFAAVNRRAMEIFDRYRGSSFIMRSPGIVSSLLMKHLRKTDYPYAMEVISDPYEVFAPGAIKHPLRPFFRRMFSSQLKKQCARAAAVSYVTETVLQKRYPARQGAFSTHYSSICLEDCAYVAQPRQFAASRKPFRLVSVGTMDQMYKAQDVLIDAVADCRAKGADLRLHFVGDGILRPLLEKRVADHGLQDNVRFLGRLPSGGPVREQLDQADLFVLPSKGEGLPRAMIEAMARALPCIGSTASGIPELLPPEAMVPPGDSTALAAKILEVMAEPARMDRMSAVNLATSRNYCNHLLQKRRIEFYRNIKELTSRHLQGNSLSDAR